MKMEKVVFFKNDGQKFDYCCDLVYQEFLDYAFDETDFFMLVFVNYNGKGYTKAMKEFKKALQQYQVKSRNNPKWPGTLITFSNNTTYKIIFYKNCEETKHILSRMKKLSDWTRPSNPQDLAFFRGNQCWFYSVGHEKIGAIIHASKKDIEFVMSHNLVERHNIFEYDKDYYDDFDEIGLSES